MVAGVSADDIDVDGVLRGMLLDDSVDRSAFVTLFYIQVYLELQELQGHSSKSVILLYNFIRCSFLF